MGFEGFPDRLLPFYEGLAADNSKAYWSDHKAVYQQCVAEPMQALLDELGPEFGEAKFFRPYRDVRFSKDKTPYKTHAAAVVGDGSAALYLQLGADGLLIAGGCYHAAADQVQRYRAAVTDPAGAQLAALLDGLRGEGWQVGGDRLKRPPRGSDADHPRAELMRHRTLTASRQDEPSDWLHTAEAIDVVRNRWRALAPLNGWLTRWVGPSREPAGPRATGRRSPADAATLR
ncbi:MAG TPA: DUF2461 domain-containing protein [Mycobacteriales bacterium]|jgi:uncharacterized protein (TIGR02453 family)|nr:DUF2461 domain-containing protein [Mycobacteriales bacterium]